MYSDNHAKRKDAFVRLEQSRKKGTVVDYEASEINAVLPRDYLELLD